MKVSRADADRYLQEVPRADALDLLFVSYLERAGADQDYITNRYTAGDLARFIGDCDGGGSPITRAIITTESISLNGVCPVSASYRMTPRA